MSSWTTSTSPIAVDCIKQIAGDGGLAKAPHLSRQNVLDRDAMNRIFDAHRIDRVIHFAGFKAVGESVHKPIEYYHNNIENTLVLVDVMRQHGCKSIIFSSSATVYGDPDRLPVRETDPRSLPNFMAGPWMIEEMLTDLYTADPEWGTPCCCAYLTPMAS